MAAGARRKNVGRDVSAWGVTWSMSKNCGVAGGKKRKKREFDAPV